jgi:monofunctional biosynthetic peptidoglycan transglycosylase
MWTAIFFAFFAYLFFIYSLPDILRMDFHDLKQKAEQHIAATEFSGEPKHEWIPLEEVSKDLIQAVISGEDSMFYEHCGVDIPAILIAMGENLRMQGRLLGASTISQQVSKNVFLSPEKTYSRKLKELFITRRLEKKFTKNEILEIYLNVAEFGPNIFGVSAAARYYFDKSATDINAAEGAFIAIMLPAPVRYHRLVFTNKTLSSRHRNKITRILKELKYKKIISNTDYYLYENYDYFDTEN